MGQLLAFPVEQAAPRIVFGRALIHRLAERAAELTGISYADLMGESRCQLVAWTRFAVMQVARENGKSTAQIGKVLGRRDHSTIITGSRRALEIAADDPDYARLVDLLRIEAAK